MGLAQWFSNLTGITIPCMSDRSSSSWACTPGLCIRRSRVEPKQFMFPTGSQVMVLVQRPQHEVHLLLPPTICMAGWMAISTRPCTVYSNHKSVSSLCHKAWPIFTALTTHASSREKALPTPDLEGSWQRTSNRNRLRKKSCWGFNIRQVPSQPHLDTHLVCMAFGRR